MKPRIAERIFWLQQNKIAIKIQLVSQKAPVTRIRADLRMGRMGAPDDSTQQFQTPPLELVL